MATFERGRSVRMQLLTTASIFALAATGSSTASFADTFSVDVGGSWLQTRHDKTDYLNPETGNDSDPHLFNVSPGNGFEANGSISWRPDDSDLIFSADLTYGRTNEHHASRYGSFSTGIDRKYFGGNAWNRVSHTLVDFQVGRDLGIGMFGEKGSSVLSIGARYAKFDDTTHVNFYTRGKYTNTSGTGKVHRGFSGIGPRLSWEASLPLGDQTGGGFTVDWGADAAAMFGRSNASDSFSTGDRGSQRHSHIIPNFDAHFGVSYHFDGGAHVSFGYMFEKFGDVLNNGAPEAPKGDGFYNFHEVDRVFYGPYVKMGYDFGG